MNAAQLKTEALCYLRFNRQLDYVCTEGSYWSADVLGGNKEYVVEIEVKTSRADLLAEFRNKKAKHAYYAKMSNWTPNYFYFLVPLELAPEAVEIVSEKMPKAGVLTYQYPRLRPGERLRVVRKAKQLHPHKPQPKMVESLRRRMGSELCGLHIAMDELKSMSATKEDIEDVKKRIVDSIIQSHGAGDWEIVPPQGAADDAAESK